MKRIFILLLIVFNYLSAYSQNVGIGTTAPESKLHIKGSVDTSQLIIDANVTQSNTHPLIRLRNASGIDLLHIHSDDRNNAFFGVYAGSLNNAAGGGVNNSFIGSVAGYLNSTGHNNTANGAAALYYNTTGSNNTANGYEALFSNTTASNNTAYGVQSLYSNISGKENTATGYQSLYFNSNGDQNIATGAYALYSNTSGNLNTAIGYRSLYLNTNGYQNIANGPYALYSNTTGNRNIATGYAALEFNNTGSFNTAIGVAALALTTNSQYNTAIGYNAGTNNDNGYNNVFVGANVDVTGPGFYNVIAIGQGTIVTGSSNAIFGNPATGYYGGYANWSNISDGRFKNNIQENVPGLDFINQLRPVTYNLNATGLDAFLHKNSKQSTPSNDKRTAALNVDRAAGQPNDEAARAVYNKALKEKETTVYTGFVAQEVEATAKKLGFNFSGVDAPKNESGVYSLRYAEFVVPLVKAVQEQQQMIADMQKRIQLLEEQNKLLQQLINKH